MNDVPKNVNHFLGSAHFERVLLVAAALCLFICAVLISRNAARLRSQLDIMPTRPTPKSASLLPRAEELAVAIEKLHQPSQWSFPGRSGLFVPEKHFIGDKGLPETLHTTELHPPVPNEWMEQFGLPITDADVLEQDSDNDGFTNLEEWSGKTNPTDANSHPEYYTKLKLKSAKEEPFGLLFSSWVGNTYAINTIDLKLPTQFVKVGDLIKGTRFKVAKFTERYQPNQYGTALDVSELTLEQEDTHQQLSLIKEKPTISPESVATFTYAWRGRQEFQVRTNQEFSLKPQEEIKYKLIDVGPTKAVIVNSRVGEPIEIGLFQQ
jgi:hypothetical protein